MCGGGFLPGAVFKIACVSAMLTQQVGKMLSMSSGFTQWLYGMNARALVVVAFAA